jgi:hypothetical protein
MKHFKSFSRTKKIIAIGAVSALTLGVAGTAFAFWTGGTGSGSGAATTGTATPFVVTVLPLSYTVPVGLFPDTISGLNTESYVYMVTNPNAKNAETLGQVAISVANSDGSTWSWQPNTMLPACTAGDFSINGAAVGTPAIDTSKAGSIASGGSASNTFKIEMIDNGANQDNCQGINVPMYVVAS